MSLSDCIFIPTEDDEEYVDALADANRYKCYTRIARV